MKPRLQHAFFTLLPHDIELRGEWPVSASRRPRIVAWPGSGLLRLRLGRANDDPSPCCLATRGIRASVRLLLGWPNQLAALVSGQTPAATRRLTGSVEVAAAIG
jgi:hypothetical protein